MASTKVYMVNYAGNTIQTTLTTEASAIDEWVSNLLQSHGGGRIIVGLDIEWRPHPIRSMSNTTATLQLCVNNKCLIVQLFYVDRIPESLKNFLSNPDATFCGVEVAEDAKKLRSEYGLHCSNTADVRALSLARWPHKFWGKPGLKDLAVIVAGLYMAKPKRVSVSDWQARVLTDEQLEYACIDAFVSYKLGQKLLVG